jgi:hypothetical protein
MSSFGDGRLLTMQGSKRIVAQLEGHGDPKSIGPWSQFFAAGMGGVISQCVLTPWMPILLTQCT